MSRVPKMGNAGLASTRYATALRCIGRDLERRGLKTFDIRFEGNEYLALCGYQNPPAPTPVTMQYTVKDLTELERVGSDKRGASSAVTDFLNPAQIFRTVGGYLDKHEARLVRMTNNDAKGKDSLFVVEYITRDGKRVIDDRAGSAIYDMCVTMYKQRGKRTAP